MNLDYWDRKSVPWTSGLRGAPLTISTEDRTGYRYTYLDRSGRPQFNSISHELIIPLLQHDPKYSITILCERFNLSPYEAAYMLVQENARLEFQSAFQQSHLPHVALAADTLRKASQDPLLRSRESWAAFTHVVANFPTMPFRSQIELSIQSEQRNHTPTVLVSPEFLDACGIARPSLNKAFVLDIKESKNSRTSDKQYTFRPYYSWDDVSAGEDIELPPIFDYHENGWNWPAVIDTSPRGADRATRASVLGQTLLSTADQFGIQKTGITKQEYTRLALQHGKNPNTPFFLYDKDTTKRLVFPESKLSRLPRKQRDFFSTPRKMATLASIVAAEAISEITHGTPPRHLMSGLTFALLSHVDKGQIHYSTPPIDDPHVRIESGNGERWGQQLSISAAYYHSQYVQRIEKLNVETTLFLTPKLGQKQSLDAYKIRNSEAIERIHSKHENMSVIDALAASIDDLQNAENRTLSRTSPEEVRETNIDPQSLTPTERIEQQLLSGTRTPQVGQDTWPPSVNTQDSTHNM